MQNNIINLEAFNSNMADIVEGIRQLPNANKPKIKTIDRETAITMFTAMETADHEIAISTLLLHEVFKILTHPKHLDAVERSPEEVQTSYDFLIKVIVPTLNDKMGEIMTSVNYVKYKFTLNKTDFIKQIAEKTTMSEHCREYAKLFGEDYKINAEGYFDLTSRKLISHFAEFVITYWMPHIEKLTHDSEAGKITENETMFIKRMYTVVNEYILVRQEERGVKERAKVKKNMQEM